MSLLRCTAKHSRLHSSSPFPLLHRRACASSPSCWQWRAYHPQQPQPDSISSSPRFKSSSIAPPPPRFSSQISRFTRGRRRSFSTSPIPRHAHLDPPKPGEERHVTFIDKDGDSHTYEVADGDNLLDIAQANDLEMEGACGGSCACSTCHVIVSSEEYYHKMAEPSDDENDMLDLAFGLTETSRLGCQVKMDAALDGVEVKLPNMTRNMQASDFQKK